MSVVDSHVYCLPPRLRDPGVHLPASEAAVAKAIHEHHDGGWVLPLSAPEAILKSMEESLIDASVLVSFPWAESSHCRENNDFILEQRAKRAERFMAVCSVQPLRAGALEEAERCLKAGAIGIKINGGWQGYELKDDVVGALARLIREKGAFILCHIDQPFRNSPTSPAHLLELARKNPGTRFVAAHMGGLLGLYGELPDIKPALSNVWFDTAVSDTVEMVRYYVSAGLEDKILFGTDHPFNHCHSQKLVRDRLEALGLGAAAQDKIFSGNLKRLTEAGA